MSVVGSSRKSIELRDRLGVLVLGMHRSGTSAVTGLFAESGYFIGADSELMEPDWGNPVGYQERLDMLAANEKVMHDLGGSWIDPPAPERQRLAGDEVAGLLSAVFEQLLAQAGPRPVAVKDPRIAALMPLWQPVLAGRLHPVLVIRDPLEIAASLAARGGTSEPLALAGWEIHTAGMLDALQGETVTIAHYGEVMSEPEAARSVVAAAGEHVAAELVDPLPLSDGTDWLRSDLRHNEAQGWSHEERLTTHQGRIWEYLAGLPSGDVTLAPPEQTTRVSEAARAAGHAEALRLADLDALKLARARLGEATEQLSACRQELHAARSHRRPALLRRLRAARRVLAAKR